MYLYLVICCFINIQIYVCACSQRHEYVSTHAFMQTSDICVYIDEIGAECVFLSQLKTLFAEVNEL